MSKSAGNMCNAANYCSRLVHCWKLMTHVSHPNFDTNNKINAIFVCMLTEQNGTAVSIFRSVLFSSVISLMGA